MINIAILLLIIALLTALSCIKPVPKNYALVIETLGKFTRIKTSGIAVVLPLMQRVISVCTACQHIKIDGCETPTADNVPAKCDIEVSFTVKDPKAFVYNVSDGLLWLKQTSGEKAKRIAGQVELTALLCERPAVEKRLLTNLQSASARLGIAIEAVKIPYVNIPPELVAALERAAAEEKQKREVSKAGA